VTVTGGTGGGDYAAGETVTITAGAPPAGKKFEEWEITPAVSFTDGTNASYGIAKFIMPASAVTATARYVDLPPTTYTVTFAGEGISTFTQSVEQGNRATRPDPDPARPGYDFGGWFIDDGAFNNEWNFNNPVTADLFLYAKWTANAGIKTVANDEIRIYPNPTKGEFTIYNLRSTIDNLRFTIESVSIYDVHGKQLSIVNLKSSIVNSIDISHLPSGVYFVKIGDVVRRVIKE
jgi:uncharacterized repeat protein (TIGR02543 family)